jgi:hypothetical protein
VATNVEVLVEAYKFKKNEAKLATVA